MSRIGDLFKSHPAQPGKEVGKLSVCLEACLECVGSCSICADACLGEANPVMLRTCARACADCADICVATAQVVARLTEVNLNRLRSQVGACAVCCRTCAEECERHAGHHEHCRICGAVCRECEQACNDLLNALAA